MARERLGSSSRNKMQLQTIQPSNTKHTLYNKKIDLFDNEDVKKRASKQTAYTLTVDLQEDGLAATAHTPNNKLLAELQKGLDKSKPDTGIAPFRP